MLFSVLTFHAFNLYFRIVLKQVHNYSEFLSYSWIVAKIKYCRTISAWSDTIFLCTAGTAFSFCSKVSKVRKCLPFCLVSINSSWKKLSSNRFFSPACLLGTDPLNFTEPSWYSFWMNLLLFALALSLFQLVSVNSHCLYFQVFISYSWEVHFHIGQKKRKKKRKKKP